MVTHRQRRLWMSVVRLLLMLVAGCSPAAAPPAEPSVVPSESTAVPTSVIELTPPPPTEPPPLPTDTAEPAPPTAEPEATEAADQDFSEGIAAYQANGCIGCHTLTIADAAGTVGPTHDGVGTTAAARIADPDYTGNATTAEEYLRESILTPALFTVPGFPEGVMPPFTDMDEAHLDAIVEMLLAN